VDLTSIFANSHELINTQFTGDGAGRDHEGYYWIRGRVDDVVNVSGHRLSTAEIEAALLEHRELYRAS
jgi:acetyl-CoA synthetase